jgi:tRNA(Ile)-lysidine synthase
MPTLGERLLTKIRKHAVFRPGDRVAVAVSGGADSIALLRLLLELRGDLGIVLSVAHVNHKLRGAESDADERFVAGLAREHDLELHATTAAISGNSGIENAARRARYDFFRRLARSGCANRIATAHTLDDQAETVLLRMFRGTGIRGLAGIHPRLQLEEDGTPVGEIVRPLLGFRRDALREYLRATNQAWREDSSNDDPVFLRNRVRQRLLPLVTREFGAAALEHVAELAEIARAEEEQWSSRDAVLSPANGGALDATALLALPVATQRRLVRAWLEVNAPHSAVCFRLIEEILDLTHAPAGKKLEVPHAAGGRGEIRRTRTALVLGDCAPPAGDYAYDLTLPGQLHVPELGVTFSAQLVDASSVPASSRDQLLDASLAGQQLRLRNWRPGDRYWPAHTRGEKKVKELLSSRQFVSTAKKLWPVIERQAGRGELVWLRQFAVPEAFEPRPGSARAIWIRETLDSRNPGMM